MLLLLVACRKVSIVEHTWNLPPIYNNSGRQCMFPTLTQFSPLVMDYAAGTLACLLKAMSSVYLCGARSPSRVLTPAMREGRLASVISSVGGDKG